jgi:hypothetical protein
MSEIDEQREEHNRRARTKFDEPSGTELAADAERQQEAQARMAEAQPKAQDPKKQQKKSDSQ